METKENNEKILQLNDLFDELIEDAYDFAQDFIMGIKLMPFASAFLFLCAIGFGWLSLYFFRLNTVVRYLYLIIGSGLLIACGIIVLLKFFEMKKKYFQILTIKEELDAIKGK